MDLKEANMGKDILFYCDCLAEKCVILTDLCRSPGRITPFDHR